MPGHRLVGPDGSPGDDPKASSSAGPAIAQTSEPAPPVDVGALAAWHGEFGPAVARWIDAHEETLDQLSDASLQIDLTDPELGAAVDDEREFREAVSRPSQPEHASPTERHAGRR